ncbi:MAG: hypothetical protein OEO77_08315 [Acidimicrobiia bacterium]|nr:hypothetical protein [Acidimicrobiia bacterium]
MPTPTQPNPSKPYQILAGWTGAAVALSAGAGLLDYMDPPSGCGGWGFFCSTDPVEAGLIAAVWVLLLSTSILVPTVVIVAFLHRKNRSLVGHQVRVASFLPVALVILWFVFRLV